MMLALSQPISVERACQDWQDITLYIRRPCGSHYLSEFRRRVRDLLEPLAASKLSQSLRAAG